MDVNNYTLEMRIKYCKDLRLLAEQIEEIKQGIIGEPPSRPIRLLSYSLSSQFEPSWRRR